MSKRAVNNNKKRLAPQVTWAQAVRDMTIAAMNKGQLPILGVIVIMFMLVWKVPDEDASELLFSLVEKLSKGEMWSYILLVGVLIGWYLHARIMRREFSAEYKRIGTEKSKLQSNAAGVNFKSSDKL